MTKQEAVDAAWEVVGGRQSFSSGEVAFLEDMADASDAAEGGLDLAAQRAMESTEWSRLPPEVIFAFLFEFCRLYFDE